MCLKGGSMIKVSDNIKKIEVSDECIYFYNKRSDEQCVDAVLCYTLEPIEKGTYFIENGKWVKQEEFEKGEMILHKIGDSIFWTVGFFVGYMDVGHYKFAVSTIRNKEDGSGIYYCEKCIKFDIEKIGTKIP